MNGLAGSAPNRIKKPARHARRLRNIERRMAQLERDFEEAGDLKAELRILDEVAQQRAYMERTLWRMGRQNA